MSQPSLSLATPDSAVRPGHADTRLRGRRLIVARSLWGLVALIDLGVLMFGLPAYAVQLHTVCTDPTRVQCNEMQLASAQLPALQQLGVSLTAYAIYAFALDLVVTLLFILVGALIFWHKSREWMGLFASLLLITFGCLGADEVHLNPLNTGLVVLTVPILLLQWPALGILFYTFPDGRFVPRRSWLLAFLFVIQFAFYVLPYPYDITHWPPLLFLLEEVVVFGSAAGTQVYRYFMVASPTQRQQIKWFAFSFSWALMVFLIIYNLLPFFFPALKEPASPYQLTGPLSLTLAYLPIPLGIGIALLRYRLWDIDTLINKALVYGLLTGMLGALYAGLVLGLASQVSQEPVVMVISTLAVAALFQPLRRRLQNLIDRRFYRKKYDAAKTLAAFSATLRQEVDLHELRERLSAIVQETMQPEHVSLWLRTPAASSAQEDEPTLTPGAMP